MTKEPRELSEENLHLLFGGSPKQSEPEQGPEPDTGSKEQKVDETTETAEIFSRLGPKDLEAEEQRRREEQAAKTRVPDRRKPFAEYTLDEWAALRAQDDERAAERRARQQAERHASLPQEQRLEAEISRYVAEGNMIAASLATKELANVRQAEALGLGSDGDTGVPVLSRPEPRYYGPDFRPPPERDGERPPEFTPPYPEADA